KQATNNNTCSTLQRGPSGPRFVSDGVVSADAPRLALGPHAAAALGIASAYGRQTARFGAAATAAVPRSHGSAPERTAAARPRRTTPRVPSDRFVGCPLALGCAAAGRGAAQIQGGGREAQVLGGHGVQEPE